MGCTFPEIDKSLYSGPTASQQIRSKSLIFRYLVRMLLHPLQRSSRPEYGAPHVKPVAQTLVQRRQGIHQEGGSMGIAPQLAIRRRAGVRLARLGRLGASRYRSPVGARYDTCRIAHRMMLRSGRPPEPGGITGTRKLLPVVPGGPGRRPAAPASSAPDLPTLPDVALPADPLTLRVRMRPVCLSP